MKPVTGIVALIDSDKSLRQTLEHVLRAAGFTVQGFHSAEEYLTSDVQAAVLLAEIDLVAMSGLQLARTLDAGGAAPPVIFMTRREDARERAEADLLGAIAYLAKPFDTDDLVVALAIGMADYTERSIARAAHLHASRHTVTSAAA